MATRRKFIKNVGSLSLASAIPFSAAAGTGIVSEAADTIRVGLIGVRGMGWADLSSFLKNEGTRCTALCDVDNNLLNRRAGEIEASTGRRPAIFGDHREFLKHPELDAVIIGTPDHWHCIQMIDSCAAGKDVYVEKPIGNSVYEADLMVEAAAKYKRVVQVGQWQRSDPHWISALEYLAGGALGRIRQVKAWADVSYGRGFEVVPDSEPPEGVDYNRWLGPAPERPFNQNRFHGSFRYFWDYAGGLMTDWGVHMIDMVLAGMQVKAPHTIMASGGKLAFPNNASETPDTLTTVFEFNDFTFIWEHFIGMGISPYLEDPGEPGVAFIGDKGILAANRKQWQVLPLVQDGNYLVDPIPPRISTENGLDAHTRNFLECIRSRQDTNCTIGMGRDAARVAHLGNISYRTGLKLKWDAARGQFVSIPEAEALLKPEYRKPWTLWES